ncbi:pep-cterm sorting domain-containing protein [Anaeramoeba ignava]|uniref:Pep-cterm sorting domain-containing protein n=1 Tax=Anaeramoeba ignava TaxID=1746090 RepID=A0A9Q0REM7_ANAIG|nr:pep-cterm sorting domain-containing protein [Anaeramoeba ignava]
MQIYSNTDKLSKDLEDLFSKSLNSNEENFNDFEIICEENKKTFSIKSIKEENFNDFEMVYQQNQEKNQILFKTHKSILSSRSEYFKSLFRSKMKEFQENKLILKDVSSSILSSILNYFYSGKIEINLENAIEILMFSSRYLIDELIIFCSNFIKNNLQIETVVDLLKLSESMDFNQLIDSCFKFISQNFKEFIKTPFFLELEENHLNIILSNDQILINEFELFESIIKWGRHKLNFSQKGKIKKQEKEQLQNQISNVIHKIRFIDLSKKELKKTLKSDLIPNQISQKMIEFQKISNEKIPQKLRDFIEHYQSETNHISLIFNSRVVIKSSIIKDPDHIKKLKEWLNDSEFFSKMKLGFSARRDGFSYKPFHSHCDDKGKTLIIIKTTENYIFGGFTKVGFITGNQRFIADPDAFIFTLKNPKKDPPQKFSIKSGKTNGIEYIPTFGPVFGAGYDIRLYGNLQPGWSDFGHTFNLPNGIIYGTEESKSYLAGSYKDWIIEELECFFI